LERFNTKIVPTLVPASPQIAQKDNLMPQKARFEIISNIFNAKQYFFRSFF